jgi:hypothetical protein
MNCHYCDRSSQIKFRCLIIFLLLLLVPLFSQTGATYPNGYSFASSGDAANRISMNSQNTANSNQKTYVWFFGYIGDTFYPEYQLGINQSTMVQVAENLSQTLGKSNLVLATSVDEIPVSNTSEYPSGTITPSMIPNITSYVSQLENYSSAVYGRLEFDQFNLTSFPGFGSCTLGGGYGPWYDCPIYNQTALYINTLHLSGVWFDIDVQYYDKIGAELFNQMMQNLTTLFPSATFILNEAPASLSNSTKNKYIVQLPGYTWVNDTYVEPSATPTLVVNESEIQQLNAEFPGHVLLHFDASGPPPLGRPTQPMAEFARETKAEEITTLQSILYQGLYPSFPNESYDLVIPIIGAWDFLNSSDPSLLYNSLSFGTYPHSTIDAFEQIILETRSEFGFSENLVKGNKATCSLPVVGTSNLLAVGISVQTAKGASPISVDSITDSIHDDWSLQSNASLQNSVRKQFVLASIYSTVALKGSTPLKISVTFSVTKSHAQGFISCFDFIGDYNSTQRQDTFGVLSEANPNSLNATAFSPSPNSIEVAIASVESDGCFSCSIASGTSYNPSYLNANNGLPATGMEFKYSSASQDTCGFMLSGFGEITSGGVACAAFAPTN